MGILNVFFFCFFFEIYPSKLVMLIFYTMHQFGVYLSSTASLQQYIYGSPLPNIV